MYELTENGNCENIGSEYSFAHAKYDAKPQERIVTKFYFQFFENVFLLAFGAKSSHTEALMGKPVVG